MLRHSPVRVALREGGVALLGRCARGEGATRVLLVTDRAIRGAGHVDAALDALRAAGLPAVVFDDVCENPTTSTIARGVMFARDAEVDFVVGLGGGSVMDAAKGVNLVLCAGGDPARHRGDPPAEALERRPRLLPMILVPTTAGTGSEAQSFALISDAATHAKLACGDRRLPRAGGLRPRVAILDPQLTRTAPRAVVAATGMDALSHAVESSASAARGERSREASKCAWVLLSGAYARSVSAAPDDSARRDMLLGAHLAGFAIECSMLGAAHACANPLTARWGVTHGVAVGLLLPHVVRHNSQRGENPYADLSASAERLAEWLEGALAEGGLPRRLGELDIVEMSAPGVLEELAADAAAQWTARFNPRPVDAAACLRIYEMAM